MWLAHLPGVSSMNDLHYRVLNNFPHIATRHVEQQSVGYNPFGRFVELEGHSSYLREPLCGWVDADKLLEDHVRTP